MKPLGWTLLLITFAILAMILATIFSQTELLQTRARQGIGSQVDREQILPE